MDTLIQIPAITGLMAVLIAVGWRRTRLSRGRSAGTQETGVTDMRLMIAGHEVEPINPEAPSFDPFTIDGVRDVDIPDDDQETTEFVAIGQLGAVQVRVRRGHPLFGPPEQAVGQRMEWVV